MAYRLRRRGLPYHRFLTTIQEFTQLNKYPEKMDQTEYQMMFGIMQQIQESTAIIHEAMIQAQARANSVMHIPAPSFVPLLTENQARHFDLLQKNLIVLRKLAIKFDISTGISGRDVARTYNVSQGRISQVMSSPVNWQPVDF